MRLTSLASFAALPRAAVRAASAPAQTGSSTQVVPFDYDPFIDAAFPEIELFDTLGGTRELNSVTLSYDQTISFDVRLEQNSPVALEAGNFFADITFLSLTTVLGGFTEIFGGYNGDPMFPEVDPNNPPEGPFFPFQDPFYGVFVDTFNIRHQGTISVTYDFTIVPAPASVALLGFAGTVAARRRR